MPVSFTIQQASSPGQINKFGETLANLFGTSEEGIHVQAFYNQISNLDICNSENMKLFLGLYEGEVVTVGSLICSKDSIGIYDIATKEGMRGRGFGSAMFNFLCKKHINLKIRIVYYKLQPMESIFIKIGISSYRQNDCIGKSTFN